MSGETVGAAVMTAAVAAARGLAEPGDTVLLAPAGASFDQFSGYGRPRRRVRRRRAAPRPGSRGVSNILTRLLRRGAESDQRGRPARRASGEADHRASGRAATHPVRRLAGPADDVVSPDHRRRRRC